jgi:hypothetical protein
MSPRSMPTHFTVIRVWPARKLQAETKSLVANNPAGMQFGKSARPRVNGAVLSDSGFVIFR